MRVRTINADGSPVADQEFDVAINDGDGQPYDPPVTIRCRFVTKAQRMAFQKQATKYVKNPVTRGTMPETNNDLLANLIVRTGVVSWTGIYGANDEPLVCTDATKDELPDHVKVQVMEAVTTTEAAGDAAASFREPAAMVRMVGGGRQE